MMYAYNELSLRYAQENLGDMLHFAVNELNYDADEYFDMFIRSGIAYSFGLGESKYVDGMSGFELAGEIINTVTGKYLDVKPKYSPNKSPEYWAGWALAYYEWEKNIPFEYVVSKVPISAIINMYNPYHEMDISQFCDQMDLLIDQNNKQSSLARLRAYAGLSQKALAEKSDVSVRMIEQYEQGKKEIKKASADTVLRLSRALNCSMEDIII